MTRRGSRRLSGVNVHDMKQLTTSIHDAADHSKEPNIAAGQLYTCLQSAIESARINPEGFGSCSTGEIQSTATLDQEQRTLISAEFYVRHAEYRDKEAFK